MSAEKLYQFYQSLGEEPFIISDDKDCNFSSWTYAQEKCEEICNKSLDFEADSNEETNEEDFDEEVYKNHLQLVLQSAYDSFKDEVEDDDDIIIGRLIQAMEERGYSPEYIKTLEVYFVRFLNDWWTAKNATNLETTDIKPTESNQEVEQVKDSINNFAAENNKTFTCVNNDMLCSIIESATKHIIYAAPSIWENVAKSLCAFCEKNENANLRIIIDADPDAFRLGFGNQAGLKLLVDKQLEIRRATGLRIAVLVADEQAWVYSPTPQIIFEQPTQKISNAVKVNVEFAKQILLSVAPDISIVPKEDILEESIIAVDLTPEIGVEVFTKQDIEIIEIEMEKNPPREFDADREVRVYQGYIQFVELSLSGCRLVGQTITIPKYLLEISDDKLRERVKTTCRMIQNKGGFSAKMQVIEAKVRKIRQEFLKSLGERYGSVMLRRRQEEFDKKLNEIQEELKKLCDTIKEDLDKELLDNRESLIEMLLPGLMRMKNPPADLESTHFGEVDEGLARRHIRYELNKQMPYVEDLISGMKLICDYKDVTFKMLDDKEFTKLIEEKFPEEKFEKLYSEEQTISEKEKKIAQSKIKKDDSSPPMLF